MSRRRPSTPQSAAALIALIVLAVFAPQLFRHPASTNPPPVTAPPMTPVTASPVTASPVTASPAAARPSQDAPTVTHPNIAFRSRATLEEHFHKHGSEFGPDTTIDTYLRAAQTLRDAPRSGDILEQKRADNVTTRFDKRTGAFLAVNPDHTIRTFFRPTDGERYFHHQAQRPED